MRREDKRGEDEKGGEGRGGENVVLGSLSLICQVSEAAPGQIKNKSELLLVIILVSSNSCLCSHYKVRCLISVAHKAQLTQSFRAVDVSRALYMSQMQPLLSFLCKCVSRKSSCPGCELPVGLPSPLGGSHSQTLFCFCFC